MRSATALPPAKPPVVFPSLVRRRGSSFEGKHHVSEQALQLPPYTQGDTLLYKPPFPQFVVTPTSSHHGFLSETRYFGSFDPLGCVCLLCADRRGHQGSQDHAQGKDSF
jgi:hypothetical protein